MKTLLAIAFALSSLHAGASESFSGALQAAAPSPAMYSFADVYRLTVSDAAPSGFPALALSDSPIRVAATQPAAAPEFSFSVVGVPEPRGWLLLSGLALALWVARRRMGYFF